jgi:hypothetical protein
MSWKLAQYPMTEGDVFDSAERGLIYAVLDAADAPAVPVVMDDPHVEAQALYESNQNPALRLVAPYLVRLNAGLMTWIRETLWSDHWGILVETDVDLKDLRRHLRRFLLVEDPASETLYFRFYDPRVLRTFLPSCNNAELADFFGPVEAYIARGEKPDEFTRFALQPAARQAGLHRSPYGTRRFAER